MTKTFIYAVRYTCDYCGWSWTPRKAEPANKYGNAIRMCPRCKRAVYDNTCDYAGCEKPVYDGSKFCKAHYNDEEN